LNFVSICHVQSSAPFSFCRFSHLFACHHCILFFWLNILLQVYEKEGTTPFIYRVPCPLPPFRFPLSSSTPALYPYLPRSPPLFVSGALVHIAAASVLNKHHHHKTPPLLLACAVALTMSHLCNSATRLERELDVGCDHLIRRET